MTLSTLPSVPVLMGLSAWMLAGVLTAGALAAGQMIFVRTYLAPGYRTSGCTCPSASAADVGCSPVLTSQTAGSVGLGPQQAYPYADAGAW